MLQSQIFLIDQTKKIKPSHLSAVATAIQIQVNRDLSQFWPISATISVGDPDVKPAPNVWPVYIVDSLPPGEGGYHMDKNNNQPYAVILNGAGWTVATSHEVVEMLVDPFGNRLQSARNIDVNGSTLSLGNKSVSYLVEIADPVESHGYVIDGVAVSDFITPAYYQDGSSGLHYDFMGRLNAPVSILPGGYISWIDGSTNHWWQILWVDPTQPPQVVDLGSATSSLSLKGFVDDNTQSVKKIAMSSDHEAVKLAALF